MSTTSVCKKTRLSFLIIIFLSFSMVLIVPISSFAICGKKSCVVGESRSSPSGGNRPYIPSQSELRRRKEKRERELREKESRQRVARIDDMVSKADSYFSKGKYKAAIRAYQKVLAMCDVDGGFYMFTIDGTKGRFDHAAERIKLIEGQRELNAEEAGRKDVRADEEAKISKMLDGLAAEFDSSAVPSSFEFHGFGEPLFSKGTKTSAPVDLKSIDSPSSIVNKEQDQYENRNKEWLKKQQDLIRQAADSEKKHNKKILSAISQIKVPKLPQKSLNDLKPGDVILVKSDSSLVSQGVTYGDVLSRWMHGSGKPQKYDISHSLVYLKTVKGKRLYLDHQMGDGFARIIDEDIFLKRYEKRLGYVARPKSLIDGKKLWEAARGAALKDNTPYGVIRKGVVCSELARFAVVQASGKRLPLNEIRFGPDITPADFIDPETEGKYFVVTPLKK